MTTADSCEGLPIVRSPAWDESNSTWRVITRATVLAVSALLLAITASFAVRRMWFAANISPVPGAWLALGALGLVALAAAQRILWDDARPVGHARSRTVGDLVVIALTSGYVVVGAVAFGSLAAGFGWQLFVALLVVAEEFWAFRRMRANRIEPQAPARANLATPAVSSLNRSTLATSPSDAVADDPDEELVDEEDAPWLPQGVTQQLTRGVDAARGEYVLGILTVDFAPGQRTETLHVAFCPPLARAPRIQLQQVDGPSLTATVGQAESFGARFELRLAQAWEEPQRVVVQFETEGLLSRSDNRY